MAVKRTARMADCLAPRLPRQWAHGGNRAVCTTQANQATAPSHGNALSVKGLARRAKVVTVITRADALQPV